jgi:adenine-specific DNA-methyltransferase
VTPFVVQNLGKYERQAWQVAEFGENGQQAALAQARYRRFILDLYGAEPIDGYAWLHGVKAGRFVHVGSVDAPVLVGDVKSIAREFWKAAGRGGEATGTATNAVDVLGWDFGFELNELGKEMAADANIELRFRRIPCDVMDKRAVEQGDTRVFELPALDMDVTAKPGRAVRIELCDFMVPPKMSLKMCRVR